MGLARGKLVNGLVINNTTGRSVMFGSYHHPTCPSVRGVHRNRLNHAKGYVTVNASLYVMYPVSWYLARCCDSSGFGVFINKQA